MTITEEHVGALLNTLRGLYRVAREPMHMPVYSTDERLYAAGALRMRFGGGEFWYAPDTADKWPGSLDLSRVDEQAVIAGLQSHGHEQWPLLVDIEQWSAKEEPELTAENLVRALIPWSLGSNRAIALYSVIPSDFAHDGYRWVQSTESGDTATAEVLKQRIRFVMEMNDRVADSVMPLVDAIVPSCYVLRRSVIDQWKCATALQILESRRIAKRRRVLPIVWHRAQVDGECLSEDEYRDVINFVAGFPGVDGLVVWTQGEWPTDYDLRDIISDIAKHTRAPA